MRSLLTGGHCRRPRTSTWWKDRGARAQAHFNMVEGQRHPRHARGWAPQHGGRTEAPAPCAPGLRPPARSSITGASHHSAAIYLLRPAAPESCTKPLPGPIASAHVRPPATASRATQMARATNPEKPTLAHHNAGRDLHRHRLSYIAVMKFVTKRETHETNTVREK